MKCIKLFGYSVYKTKEIEPVIEKANNLEQTNIILEKQKKEADNELRICKQLLDSAQNSVIQLNKYR